MLGRSMTTSIRPLAPTPRRGLCSALVALAALLTAACTSVEDDVAPTTTTAAPVLCPDGNELPVAGPAAAVPAIPPQAADPPATRAGGLDIATLLPRTGDLAFLGPAPTIAARLAVDDIGAAGGVLGRPLTLREGDAAPGADATAEAEIDRLLGAGVDAVVGPITSGVTARVLDRVDAAGGLLVSPGNTSSALDTLDAGGRLFRTAPTDDLQGRALAELVLEDGASTAALVVRSDDYGRTIADAFATRFAADGGAIASRMDYAPTEDDIGSRVDAEVDRAADAVVVIGLAETALVLDALVASGQGPRDRLVYGTDGNLGDRLADLVDDPASLACLRGLLPVATPADDFAGRLRERAADEAALDGAVLDHAAETYDAVVVVALAAQVAGTDDAAAIAAALAGVTRGGTVCDEVQVCLDLAAEGTDLAYEGASGRLALDADGNRTSAELTLVTFDGAGRLTRIGSRAVPS